MKRKIRNRNRYSGYHPENSYCEIDRISANDIDPIDFYCDYILRRKPCIIYDMLSSESFSAFRMLTEAECIITALSRFCPKVLDAEVYVEKRNPLTKTFGSGIDKSKMSMRMFLELLRDRKGEEFYLTTQYEIDPANPDSEPYIMKEPLKSMISILPLRPGLFERLVPHQYNIWIGQSEQGTSSGCHHDFHDNLYILLKGRKRFTLFSPKDALLMYTNQPVKFVHHNGLICYGDHVSDNIEIESDGEMEELVYLRSDGYLLSENIQESEEEGAGLIGSFGSEESDFEWAREDSADDFEADERVDSDGGQQEEPPSFSQIPVPVLHTYLSDHGMPGYERSESDIISDKQFPLLNNATAIQAELSEGECLYLPASWFHEVTSYSNQGEVHTAINYWFHPPSASTLSEPTYPDDTWETRYRTRIESIMNNGANSSI